MLSVFRICESVRCLQSVVLFVSGWPCLRAFRVHPVWRCVPFSPGILSRQWRHVRADGVLVVRSPRWRREWLTLALSAGNGTIGYSLCVSLHDTVSATIYWHKIQQMAKCVGAAPGFGSVLIKGGSHLELWVRCCRDSSDFPTWNSSFRGDGMQRFVFTASTCDRNVARVKRFILPDYWLKTNCFICLFFCCWQRAQTLAC